MTQLDQEIPKIKGSTILSTLDVTSGFWTIPVHPDDQHKLAFTFGHRQYTFTRCPFGYANSPAEFNIFLNKACPDARVRGNLVYVDDVLMKSSSVEDHLKEIDHVLNQLTTAGAKIALHKGHWCKTKVNYVALLVGRNGIEAVTSSMTKTSKWSLMQAKRCFPQNAIIQTAKMLCFALCGPSSVSLITSVHRKSSSRPVTSQSPSSTVNESEMAW